MRFMIMVLATKEADEAGRLPTAEELAEMGKYQEEMVKAGVLMAGEGLRPTSLGARVKFVGGGKRPQVIDGPFTESKEIVGGYAITEVASEEEALELATEFMELHRKHWPEFEGESELRPIETGEPGSE